MLTPQQAASPVFTFAGSSRLLGVVVARFDVWTVHGVDTSRFDSYPYSQCYAVEAVDQAAAYVALADLLGWERAIHRYHVMIAYGKCGRSFGFPYAQPALSYNQRGLVGASSDDYPQPAWAIVVNWRAGDRWIGRKWLRLGLVVGDVLDGELSASYTARIETEYIAPIVAAGVWYSRGGVLIADGVVDRQLRLYGLRHGTTRRQQLHI